MQPSDEIKSKLDIVDIIRDYIQIRPAGMNFRANCPFHREKTPSFMVSPEKQIWHCFGCGKGGDVISFLMEIEGVDFMEALRILAPKAGVTFKRFDGETASKRSKIIDILESSADYYHKILIDDKRAENARKYLIDRDLNEKTISEWQIGFSLNDWEDLILYLKRKGFRDEEIFASGMSIKKEGTSRYYNRFRGRIMFPIKDINGIIIAFTARVSPEMEETEKMGKYINSPQTAIYDKSKVLFGLDRAKMHIKSEDRAILVEGQMDVITAHQNDFKNVIASSGTALSNEQIKLIKRYTNNIYIAFDMDSAGEMAADRGIREAMRGEMNIKVISLPEGKDPDDCIKKDPAIWKNSLENAKPMMKYYFDKIFNDADLENIDIKKKSSKQFLTIISSLENEIEKSAWIKNLSQKIGVDEIFLIEALNKNKKINQYVPKEVQNSYLKKTDLSREEMLSEILLALMLKFPQLIEYAIGNLISDQISAGKYRHVYNYLIIYYNNKISAKASSGSGIDFHQFSDWIKSQAELNKKGGSESDNQLNFIERLVILSDKDYSDLEKDQVKKEFVNIIISLKKIYLNKRMKELETYISELEKKGEKERVKALFEDLRSLNEEKKSLE